MRAHEGVKLISSPDDNSHPQARQRADPTGGTQNYLQLLSERAARASLTSDGSAQRPLRLLPYKLYVPN